MSRAAREPGQEFLREGLPVYGATLRAAKEFESTLGSLCARSVEQALTGFEGYDIGDASQVFNRWGRPEIGAWADVKGERNEWAVWAYLCWNREEDGWSNSVEVNMWKAPEEVAERAKESRPKGTDIQGTGPSFRFARLLESGEHLEEELVDLIRSTMQLYVDAAETNQA